MFRTLNIISSTVASSVRAWRGTTASKQVKQPQEDLILFDREGCTECRYVREALTELNLDVVIAPCPEGGKNIAKFKKDSHGADIPFLVDPNTDKKIAGRQNIISYLFSEYRGVEAPNALLGDSWLHKASSELASAVRFSAGIKAKPSRPAKLPLTLYSFESSPFSRLVRERLCEYEIPYKLINLGKQQWSDMGPAKARFTLKEYCPLPNTKRDEFFKQHGDVQVPYLVDPNTATEQFESKDIVEYLDRTYGR